MISCTEFIITSTSLGMVLLLKFGRQLSWSFVGSYGCRETKLFLRTNFNYQTTLFW